MPKNFLPFDIIKTDHITPIAKGGSHKISNLQLLHAACHDKKIEGRKILWAGGQNVKIFLVTI